MSLDKTPFRESSSPLVILFVPCTSCWGSSTFSSARARRTGNRQYVGWAVEAYAFSKFHIISNSCGPFSHFENRIKWNGNDRTKQVTSKERKLKFLRCAYRTISFTVQIQCLSRCSYRQKDKREIHKIPEFHLEIIILCQHCYNFFPCRLYNAKLSYYYYCYLV